MQGTFAASPKPLHSAFCPLSQRFAREKIHFSAGQILHVISSKDKGVINL